MNNTIHYSNNAKFAFLKTLDVTQDVESRLSLLLSRTIRGSEDAILTPIAKEFGPDFLLNEFNKIYETNSYKLNDVLKHQEMLNRDKFGPRSVAIPWKDRKESLKMSFDHHDMVLDKLGRYGSQRLRPLSLIEANKLLKNSTNSGMPFYAKKGTVKQRVLDDFDNVLLRRDPCILFTRTQESKKTRNVWGFPIADTLNEMRYYSPLLKYQRELKYRAALRGPDQVAADLTQLIIKARDLKRKIYSIDFSAFDTSVNPKLQANAFNYIKSLFQSSFSNDLDYIAERFCSIGIITPDGVLNGRHGVPSGSTFTNEVDSIVQMQVSTSLPFINIDDIQVQGDDGVYLISEENLEKLNLKFRESGLNVAPIGDKSRFEEDYALYLQNIYHIDYMKDGLIGGIYPIYRALNRILYQERWSDFEDHDLTGKDYYSIRTICIVENCKYHPLFQNLVEFILKYDKYSLEFSDQGIRNYVQMIESASGAGEAIRHQYEDFASGIKDFETYKRIKLLS